MATHPKPAALPQPPRPVAMPPQSKPKSKTLALEYPVNFAGLDYTQLVVRRLKAKDFRQLDLIEGGGNAAAIAMAALICNVEEGVIDELDAADYVKLQEVIADFFPKAMADKLQPTPSAS
jgi:Phage tail assembly chaperone proteins, E, or 41 or 14